MHPVECYSATSSIQFYCLKKNGSGEMVQCLRTQSAVAEKPNSVISTHVKLLTTACYSSAMGDLSYMTSIGIWTHVHISPHILIIKIKSKSLNSQINESGWN